MRIGYQHKEAFFGTAYEDCEGMVEFKNYDSPTLVDLDDVIGRALQLAGKSSGEYIQTLISITVEIAG